MTPIITAISNVLLLLEEINTSPGTYAATDLKNVFLFIPVHRPTRSNLLSSGMASNTLSLSYLRGMSTLQPYVIL